MQKKSNKKSLALTAETIRSLDAALSQVAGGRMTTQCNATTICTHPCNPW